MSSPWDDATLRTLLSFDELLLFFTELTQYVLQIGIENELKMRMRLVCNAQLNQSLRYPWLSPWF